MHYFKVAIFILVIVTRLFVKWRKGIESPNVLGRFDDLLDSILLIVRGSPNLSSLNLTYLGPIPGKYGPEAYTGLTPFFSSSYLCLLDSGIFLKVGWGLAYFDFLPGIEGPEGEDGVSADLKVALKEGWAAAGSSIWAILVTESKQCWRRMPSLISC
ncbi:hypothetical protein CRG98_047559 [Punica granatum]|uniref:Uncharacterized protein n=1 Tax=Punica granatum TaxID=22663 RepID=A0A2I0HKQ1_PUNGR|nr:hypothetical protein CRG98_047559 [Punica granatum]